MFDFLGQLTLRLISAVIQQLPIAWSLGLARCVGNIAYLFDKRRFVAYANIKAAFPNQYSPGKIKSLVRHAYVHFAQVAAEMLYFPKMDRTYANRFIEMPNRPLYDEAFSGARGTMLMTAHAGNWELMQIYSGLIGNPMRVLVREQKMGALDQLLNELRSSHGSTPVFTKGMQIRDLIETLKNGHVVGVLGDQGGGRDGMIVRFFGRKTTAPSGLFSIALRFRSQVIPCFSYRKGGPKHEIILFDPIQLLESGNEGYDNQVNYQQYLNRLEQFISEHPEQWLWIYKRWKFCFTKRIIALEDVRAGHATQALSISQTLEHVLKNTSKEYEVHTERVRIEFQSSFKRIIFFVLSIFFWPFAQSRLSLLRFFLTRDSYEQLNRIPYGDFIVSCGSGLAPLNLWLTQEFRAKSVSVMKPPFPYSWFHYDLIISPKHDHACARSQSVQMTIAPNLVSSELLERARQELMQKVHLNGRERIAVFVGGRSKQYEFDRKEFQMWAESLKNTADQHQLDLLVTTSRRTESDLSDYLKEKLQSSDHCKLLVIANEKNIENVTYGMLAVADIVVVTEDSVSMISEALSSGKRVIVLKIGNHRLPKKFKTFQEQLMERNLIHVANAHDFEVKLNSVRKLNVKSSWLEEERKMLESALRHLV